jgi:hypothetical protein
VKRNSKFKLVNYRQFLHGMYLYMYVSAQVSNQGTPNEKNKKVFFYKQLHTRVGWRMHLP